MSARDASIAAPEGWVLTTLGDCARFNPRHIDDIERDTLVSFVPMPAVDEHSGEIEYPQARPLREVWKGYTHFREGDVIVAKITPCMENGKAAVARKLENGLACGSTEFHVLRPHNGVSPDFLWRYVRQKSFREEAEQSMTGAVGQRRVPLDFLKKTELGLPPTDEQHRIVAKIDSLSAKSKRARDHLNHLPRLVERYKSSILKAAYRGELTKSWRMQAAPEAHVNARSSVEIRKKFAAEGDFTPPFSLPKSWRWIRLPQLGDLDRGKSRHRPRNDSRLYGGNYPFIQTGEVRAANRFLTNYNQTYSKFGLAQSRLWPADTVCITIAANIAETAILGIDACFPDSVVGFIADKSRTTSSYVEFFLRTAREELKSFAPATAQKNINLDTLANVRLPVAPLDEQAEIVRRIEAAFAWIDRLAAEANSAHKLINSFDQAILSKAFRGELVPQDPNDEPARFLLDRIRAEKTGVTQLRRGRGRPRTVSA